MTGVAVLTWALRTGLAITVLVVLILCVRRPVARWFGAGAAYALWLLPIIRLFMPVITVPEFIAKFIPIGTETTESVERINSVIPPNLPEGVTAIPLETTVDLYVGLAVIWLALAALWFSYQILRHLHQIQSLRLKTEVVSAELEPLIETVIERLSLRRRPEIRMSQAGFGPMVTQFWRPMIVLPQNFTQLYSAEQQSFALTHEMAHIKRFDLWAAFAVLMFRALNWPNPLVHYAAHKFRADQEAACDAYLLAKLGDSPKTKQNYARTLIKAAKHMPGNVSLATLELALSDPMSMNNEDLKGEKNETI